MSINNGVWHDAELDPPGAADVSGGWQHFLIVKENKSGERVICFGAFIAGDYDPVTHRYNGKWTTNNGKGKVLYWMPLPKIPEK